MPRISSAVINRGSLRPLPSEKGDATSRGYKFSVTTKKPDVEETRPEIDGARFSDLRREMEAAFREWSASSGPVSGALVLADKDAGQVDLDIFGNIHTLGELIDLGDTKLRPNLIVANLDTEGFSHLADWSSRFAPTICAVKTPRSRGPAKRTGWTLFGPAGKIARYGFARSGKLAETTHPKRR